MKIVSLWIKPNNILVLFMLLALGFLSAGCSQIFRSTPPTPPAPFNLIVQDEVSIKIKEYLGTADIYKIRFSEPYDESPQLEQEIYSIAYHLMQNPGNYGIRRDMNNPHLILAFRILLTTVAKENETSTTYNARLKTLVKNLQKGMVDGLQYAMESQGKKRIVGLVTSERIEPNNWLVEIVTSRAVVQVSDASYYAFISVTRPGIGPVSSYEPTRMIK